SLQGKQPTTRQCVVFFAFRSFICFHLLRTCVFVCVQCPDGIEHWTLWSVKDLCHGEVCEFVEDWLATNFPHVHRWNYDDNLGQRSIELFHVHVYIEMKPFSFQPDPEKIYRPIYRFDLTDDDLSDASFGCDDSSQ